MAYFISDGEGGIIPLEGSLPAGYGGPVYQGRWDGQEWQDMSPVDPSLVNDPALQYGAQGSLPYQLATVGRLQGGLSNPDTVSKFLSSVAPNYDWTNAIQSAYDTQVGQFGSGFNSGADDPAQTALKIIQASGQPWAADAANFIRGTPQFAQSQAMGAQAQNYAQHQNDGTILGIPGEAAALGLGIALGPAGLNLSSLLGGGAIGAAGTGALSSALLGGDPLKGALFGGLTPGLQEAGLSPEMASAASSAAKFALSGGSDMGSLFNGALNISGGWFGGAPSGGYVDDNGNFVPDVFAETDQGMADALANPVLPDFTSVDGNSQPPADIQPTGNQTTNTDNNMAGFFDDYTGLDLQSAQDAELGQAWQDLGVEIPQGSGYEGNVYNPVGDGTFGDAAAEDAGLGQAWNNLGVTAPQGSGPNGNIYNLSVGTLLKGLLSGDKTLKAALGGAASTLGNSSGSNILGQITSNPAQAAFNATPFLLSLYEADRQKNDIQPYIDKLNTLGDQFTGNQSAFLKSVTDPYDQQTATGYGRLNQSLADRGVLGSSFGNADLANYDYLRGVGRGNLVANATNQSVGAASGLVNSALTATNNRNLSRNALIGAGLNASANLFKPADDPFNLKNLLGV